MIPKDPLIALDEAVKAKGTASAFARDAGFSSSYICDVLAQRKRPSDKLLRALGLSRVVVKL